MSVRLTIALIKPIATNFVFWTILANLIAHRLYNVWIMENWSTNFGETEQMSVIHTEKDVALQTLQSFIEQGNYSSGDRLPSERDLMTSLGMTRTMLRKALDALEREGFLWRHVGKGTFIADQSSKIGRSGRSEIGHQLTPIKMMRARLAIEPAIAREAAINASGEAIVRMKIIQERARAAESWAEYELQDDNFHRAVAQASDNILLLALFDELNSVRRSIALNIVVRGTKKPPREHRSFEQHEMVIRAIDNREPAAAYDAMRIHIKSVSARLFEEV